jgi:hypothetical protein
LRVAPLAGCASGLARAALPAGCDAGRAACVPRGSCEAGDGLAGAAGRPSWTLRVSRARAARSTSAEKSSAPDGRSVLPDRAPVLSPPRRADGDATAAAEPNRFGSIDDYRFRFSVSSMSSSETVMVFEFAW